MPEEFPFAASNLDIFLKNASNLYWLIHYSFKMPEGNKNHFEIVLLH